MINSYEITNHANHASKHNRAKSQRKKQKSEKHDQIEMIRQTANKIKIKINKKTKVKQTKHETFKTVKYQLSIVNCKLSNVQRKYGVSKAKQKQMTNKLNPNIANNNSTVSVGTREIKQNKKYYQNVCRCVYLS